jgi:uncharacterized protein
VNELIEIEVAYAFPENQILECLKVPYGTTVAQAVQLSEICNKFPEIQPDNKNLGVFGKLVKPETILRNHDRVEIYRPIIVDPKEKRKKRAENNIASNKKN